jgi:hypothetical protein
MSYWVRFDVAVCIKTEHREALSRELAKWRAIAAKEDISYDEDAPAWLATQIQLDETFLDSGYVYFVDEIDSEAWRWVNIEEFALWLKPYAEADGKIVVFSCEGDAEAWGYEFNGKGKMKELKLKPVGRWS